MKPVNVCAVLVLISLATAGVATQTDETIFTAVSANVADPGGPVKIRIQRWSASEQAAPLIAALSPPPPAPRGAGADGVPRGAGPAGSEGARAGGAAGRAGRARGRGRGAAPAAPLSPTAALAQAIGRAPTIGYLWTADVTGYAIKYAYRAPLPDGGERVILATDRRLGTHTAAWQPTSSDLTDYEFTVIEIRFNGKGVGEGKTSLTTKVIVDNEAKTVALENYATAAPILRNVKRS
jgi:hypothetical protein